MTVQARRPSSLRPENDKPKYRTLLVDGHNLFIRSAVNNDSQKTYDGFTYGAMWQFLFTLKNLIAKSYDYDYIYVFFDGDYSGQKRYEIYKPYKGNRPDKIFLGTKEEMEYKATEYARKQDEAVKRMLNYFAGKKRYNRLTMTEADKANEHRQIEILKSMLDQTGVRVISYQFVESDDLIAYYVNHKEENEQIIIVSNDRDIAQLLREDVAIYSYEKKKFITTKNYKEFMDIHYSNIVVEKIFCGDSSDNIKGIKGVAEKSLHDLCPKMLSESVSIQEVIDCATKINKERVEAKKKPLAKYENITNGISDGEQGENFYDVQQKLIDLSLECMLTDEAKAEMDAWMHAPMEITTEHPQNIYKTCTQLHLDAWKTPTQFGTFWSTFQPIYNKEVKRYQDYCNSTGTTSTIINKTDDTENVPF